MKKHFLTSLMLLGTLQAGNTDLLTGDTALACEAILCLSSPAMPSECMPSLQRYFGISYSKPWKTIQARMNFLNLCPVVAQTPEMKAQAESLSQITGTCTEQELNAQLEKSKQPLEIYKKCKVGDNGIECMDIPIFGYRINPKMTKNCEILSRMTYNDYQNRFKYTCNKQFYKEYEWNAGKKIIAEISQSEYNALKENERFSRTLKERTGFSYKEITHYYRAEPIEKHCWVDTGGSK
ncbi:TrbM/KikA/MpfK family conjugal transfer protein [Campylobacter cuniculorum]|uniref:Conjugal transfer protein TrbM n=2 Tax=Campylobacter cuniculorum TaxID=374106 RepID=A0A1W6BYG1_9BACT|nr:TrbM/KikA/MpfK family conjugal transfer protein [Campylobacter cuniculorum]ARJ57102.1 conjugal transfer protein TrbM [Campylobacter cuniculorum DSM 23162 = LMG 24588]QOR04547.1 hypothetical protein A0071_00940 [Campylobacter cuniculorum]